VWDGDEMNEIGHQAIADQLYPVSLDALLKQGEIDAALSITLKDEAPRIASLRYVMGEHLEQPHERIETLKKAMSSYLDTTTEKRQSSIDIYRNSRR